MIKPEGYKFPQVTRYKFDIDVFHVLDQLKNIYINNPDQVPEHLRDLSHINGLEDSFVKEAKELGIDLSDNQKYRNCVLSSVSNSYPTFLAYTLLVIDPYRIELFLSYQSQMYLGNHYAKKNNFLGLIEFQIYEQVKLYDILNQDIRLEKIMNWVERNKIFKKGDDCVGEGIDETLAFKVVEIDPSFAETLFDKLKTVIAKEHHSNLHGLLLNGEPTRICFNGKRNQLAELFKRLRYNNKITVKSLDILANWLVTNFYVLDDTGKPEKLNKGTILQILKNPYKECTRMMHLFEEIAEFIPINQRKNN
ncbi:MAG: hypothetical protein A3K10_09855 [Bacteroidetes bacterium RIFCSPLOWO2_12_FULL_31_6]|nr:MAG: hypothetical protein A3K10_09855 [Bacteroidetes bacterium RIFCSPLOWO2_12_FULL_31_6]